MQEFLFRHGIKDKVLAVGVSGGADSLALVLKVKQELTVFGYKIIALTVNHNLRPSAAKEADYVAHIMAQYNIEHHILEWTADKPESGLEEAARLARYTLMKEWCESHKVQNLMVAHHLLDQAETFLMRLQRGSGLDGLCSIREVSNWNGLNILRPLLHTHPQELKNYLRQQNIQWVEDESNQDTKYLRNRVRKFLPLLEQNIDISAAKIDEAVQNLQSAEEYIEEQVKNIVAEQIKCYADTVYAFRYSNFLKWHKEIKFRILSRICRKAYIPRADSVMLAIKNMSSLPFSGITLGGKEIFLAYGQIFVVPELQAKHKASRKAWEEYIKNNLQYQKIRLPHKARIAILEKHNAV